MRFFLASCPMMTMVPMVALPPATQFLPLASQTLNVTPFCVVPVPGGRKPWVWLMRVVTGPGKRVTVCASVAAGRNRKRAATKKGTVRASRLVFEELINVSLGPASPPRRASPAKIGRAPQPVKTKRTPAATARGAPPPPAKHNPPPRRYRPRGRLPRPQVEVVAKPVGAIMNGHVFGGLLVPGDGSAQVVAPRE